MVTTKKTGIVATMYNVGGIEKDVTAHMVKMAPLIMTSKKKLMGDACCPLMGVPGGCGGTNV